MKLARSWLVMVPGVLCLAGCASFAPNPTVRPSEPTLEFRAEETALGRTYARLVRDNAPNSGFRMVSTGVDGLRMRLELIDAAEKTLDLQYYIFHADRSGRLVEQALLSAADRGVHIRILLDDGETTDGDEKLLTLAAHPCIQVRNFNPFRYRGHSKLIRATEFLLRKSRLDYRMHNKLFVADDAIALTGGRNIGDQYFQISPESQFGDDDIVAVGPIVKELSAEFEDYWTSSLVVSAEQLSRKQVSAANLEKLRQSLTQPPVAADAVAVTGNSRAPSAEPSTGIVPHALSLSWSQATLVYDSPDKRRVSQGSALGSLMYPPIARRIAGATFEIVAITPYFIPAQEELDLLQGERDKNVHVRFLTNSLAAAPELVAHAGYMHYRRTLLNDGVHLYEIRPLLGSVKGSGESTALVRRGAFALHAKLLVIDRSSLFVGSMNMDQRSLRLNTEMGLIIDSPSLAQEVGTRFDALTQPKNAYEVILAWDPTRGTPHVAWKTEEAGMAVQYSTEPARSAMQRVKANLLALLPLDREL